MKPYLRHAVLYFLAMFSIFMIVVGVVVFLVLPAMMSMALALLKIAGIFFALLLVIVLYLLIESKR